MIPWMTESFTVNNNGPWLQDYTDTDDHMDQFTTHPSPKPTFCPKWEVGDNVGLGEG